MGKEYNSNSIVVKPNSSPPFRKGSSWAKKIKFVEKRISDRKKYHEKLTLQLNTLKEILELVKKSEKDTKPSDE